MAAIVIPTTAAGTGLPFTDVKEGKWYYEDVKAAYELGIMGGQSETIFAPTSYMTRAEFVTLLSRLGNAELDGMAELAAKTFTDVGAKKWFAPYIGWANSVGVVNGYGDGTFLPNKSVSRQELAVMFQRFMALEGIDFQGDRSSVSEFADKKDIGSWANDAVELLRRTGLVGGDNNGNFNPKKSVTRAEIAAIAVRFVAFKEEIKPAHTHTPGDEATCTEPQVCTECGEIIAPAKGHTPGAEATCTEAQKCTVCGAELAPAKGHTPGAEATCTEPQKCTVCGAELAPAKGHTPGAEATCTEPQKCTVCGAELAPAKGHTPGEEATCTDPQNCTVCGEEIVPAKGHAPGAEATCTEPQKCLVCGIELVAALGHNWDDGEITTAPTYDEEGVLTYTCGRCGVQKTEAIPKKVFYPKDMPTADRIGIQVQNEELGITVSNPYLFKDEDGNWMPGDGSIGTHGAHENKILRTKYGVYSVFVTSSYEKEDGYNDISDVFQLVKITDKGCHVIMEGEFPEASGSCLPEVFAGEDGIIYVSTLANLYEEAWMNIYKIDEKTETVISEAPYRPSFELVWNGGAGFCSHGYGYSMPIPDVKNHKIYCLYAGGDLPGCLAWFIYDTEKDEWDTECYSVIVDSRPCYFYAYADGNGGFRFFGQRDVKGGPADNYVGLTNWLGVDDVIKATTGMVFDAIYLYHVKDATKEEIEVTDVYVPDYRAIYNAKKAKNPSPQKTTYVTASYYGESGTAFQDLNGDFHIIYYETENKEHHHAIFDKNDQLIYNQIIDFTDAKGTYTMGMTQDANGKFYIVAWNESSKMKNANLEIWASDDGREFTRVIDNFKLTTTDEYAPDYYTKLIVTSTRNNSVLDGTLGVLFFEDTNKIGTNGDNLANYYYVSVELYPDHVHTPGEAATCTEPQICTTCLSVIAPATGHVIGENDGCLSDIVCTVCGEIITPAKGSHTWDEGVVTKDATIYEAGTISYQCVDCDAQKTESIEKLYDPNPDSLGVLYQNDDGLKVSLAKRSDVDVGPSGLHGGHHSMIVRTEYGTFTTYLTEYYSDIDMMDFAVNKIEDRKTTTLFTDSYYHNNGASRPNISYNGNGTIFVTVFTLGDEADRNEGGEHAHLIVYEIDAKTGEYTKSAISPAFVKTGVHGYGYAQPVIDNKNGKIYALYTGGDIPGYLAWFIYDTTTHTWDTTCHWVENEYRLAYFNAYPTDDGGFVFVGQRDVKAYYLGEKLGVTFNGASPDSGYAWDALYICKVADPTVDNVEVKTIREPTYVPNAKGLCTVQQMNNYASGCTFMDASGRIHVLYTHKEKAAAIYMYHAIYAQDLTEIKNEKIVFTAAEKKSNYAPVIMQGSDGTIYFLLVDTGTQANPMNIEIWKSADGSAFTKYAEGITMQDENGTTFPCKDTTLYISSPRNMSVLDDTFGLLFSKSVDGVDAMYYFSVELPH